MDEGSKGTAQAKCLYINERYQIPVKGSMKVSELKKLVGKAAKHPAKEMRLYHHGRPLLDMDATLASMKFGRGEPRLYYIYLEDPPLPDNECFSDGKPDLKAIKRQFDTSGLLTEKSAIKIVKDCVALMREESNMVTCEDPCSIIGDIHGQWFDMAGIITNAGTFGQRNMMFLGDYVDRGSFNCETILYLMAAKICYPKKVFLLRGNHESRKTTKSYGSQAEFIQKYGKKFNKVLTESFDYFPVLGLIESCGKRLLCMHGGLSEKLDDLDDVEDFDRKTEPPKEGPLKDVLWADPFKDCDNSKAKFVKEYDLDDLNTHAPEARASFSSKSFHANKERGGSLKFYGYPAVLAFMEKNEITGIFRGHQQKQSGIEQYKFGPEFEFPAVTTVFSAPNYCDKSQNTGGVVSITDGKVRFKTYTWALHPQFFPFDCKTDKPFQRDMDTEDFIQFVNYNQHEALRKIPLCKLKGEYLAIFKDAGAEKGSKANKKSVAKAIDNGADFTHQRVMGGGDLDDKQMALIKQQGSDMMKRYQGFDHFADALKTEDLFEKDPDNDDFNNQVNLIMQRNQLASTVASGSKVGGAIANSKAKRANKKMAKKSSKKK
jgi:diadenosine tetraphosphatase ApaH/serine/threonine PP2A family protein phosphatase